MIDHTALPHYRYPHRLLFFLCFILSLPFTTITAVSGASATTTTPHFREAPKFYNSPACASMPSNSNPCSKDLIHVAMTLDATYLRGTMAAIFSILQHSSCPECIHFHLITAATTTQLSRRIATSFPYLRFTTYEFNTSPVSGLISTSIRPALDNPLNYARNYLPDLLPTCVTRVVYLDSDIILVDDIQILAATPIPNPYVLAAPEYCNADFKSYFTPTFWANPSLSMALFEGRIGSPCYFNTGVMVIDLSRWRAEECTRKIVEYMELQKRIRIYELGSLPPFLLAFAGNVATVDHRWNQHGLGGDNYLGICRELHPGPVSLLHWSGKGKPWVRLDENRPCPLDTLWVPYDLLEKKRLVDLDP